MEARCYRAMHLAQGRMLREYFSGVPVESLSKRYGYSIVKIRALATEYKREKINIFDNPQKRRIAMSIMTENGNPYENAVAERVNGILKTEWLYHMTLESCRQAQRAIEKIVFLYNNVRPHGSIGNMTPAASRNTSFSQNPPKKLWKNYWRMKQQAAVPG